MALPWRPTLRQFFQLPEAPVVALVGAGGKTRALWTLAEEYNPPVVMTTTTHLGEEQVQQAPLHWVLEGPDVQALARRWQDIGQHRVLITGPLIGGRWQGLSPEQWAWLCEETQNLGIPLLVEADGAARKPLKAPEAHEPALLPGVTHVLTVAGLDVLGQPLRETWVHRAERFAALADMALGEAITPQVLARVLAHPEGGRKGVSPEMSWGVLLVGEQDLALAQGQRVVEALWAQQVWPRVVVARRRATDLEPLAVFTPVAGVVLAAGPSSRFPGQHKLLLSVAGEPMVRRVTRTALEAGLSPVVVVVGYRGEEVAQALEGLPVQVVENPAWESGQSTSVRTGVEALPPTVGAAVFLLADMPLVPPTLVRALVEVHQQTQVPIVAPLIEQQRGNPVLFDARMFPQLQALQGDVGGRALLTQTRAYGLPWFDETTQWDVDSPEDYQRVVALLGR